jgi:hypothetical protein
VTLRRILLLYFVPTLKFQKLQLDREFSKAGRAVGSEEWGDAPNFTILQQVEYNLNLCIIM